MIGFTANAYNFGRMDDKIYINGVKLPRGRILWMKNLVGKENKFDSTQKFNCLFKKYIAL